MPIKTYKQLTLPPDTAWDRKVYNPIRLLDRWLYRNFTTSWIYINLDKYIFIPLDQFTTGIQNLIKWFPIIWKDRNWDHSYILEILQHKLILQREYLVSNNRHTMVDMDNKYITICLNLIERMKEDYYELEHYDYIDEDIWWTKDYSLESKINKENLDEYFAKYPLIVRRILNRKPGLNKKRMLLASKVADMNQQRCKRLLFKILNEKIEGWWD